MSQCQNLKERANTFAPTMMIAATLHQISKARRTTPKVIPTNSRLIVLFTIFPSRKLRGSMQHKLKTRSLILSPTTRVTQSGTTKQKRVIKTPASRRRVRLASEAERLMEFNPSNGEVRDESARAKP